ncbi:hypothetical protein ACFX2C_007714 [Malus domestica]
MALRHAGRLHVDPKYGRSLRCDGCGGDVGESDTDSRGEGASSARVAWSERWAGPGGDVMAPGVRSCKEGSMIGRHLEQEGTAET